MEAKEKAKDLYNQFYNTSIHSNSVVVRHESAKECALIAVVEIQKELEDYVDTVYDGYGYWEQVKHEINLL